MILRARRPGVDDRALREIENSLAEAARCCGRSGVNE